METDKPLIAVGTYVQQSNISLTSGRGAHKRYGKVIRADAKTFTVRWNGMDLEREYEVDHLAEGHAHRIERDQRSTAPQRG